MPAPTTTPVKTPATTPVTDPDKWVRRVCPEQTRRHGDPIWIAPD